MKRLVRRPDIDGLRQEAGSDNRLKRALGPVNLIMLGIGGVIGTGIFVLTGTVAAQNAGPAVILSFILAGIASIFAALCYSEFASRVPVAGSAYTYAYATLGEIFAWILGWDLILEYAVGSATVAVGWSGYVVSFLNQVGIHIPPEMTLAPGTVFYDIPSGLAASLHVAAGWTAAVGDLPARITAAGVDPSSLPHMASLFNLPAVIIVALVTTLLALGVKESANFNNGIVILKLAVILLFIFGTVAAVNVANWKPFVPDNTGSYNHFGWTGVMAGAGIVFFAYIGFDAVSTAAQEAKNPRRDMPIGIIGSLLICTVLYIAMAAIATGVVPYKQLGVSAPIALVADRAGLGWMSLLIKIGAILGLSSVILVLLYGQSRVFYSMSRDGLLPKWVNHVHPRFKTPWLTTWVVGAAVALAAAFTPIGMLGEMCSIGTLLAFVIVCLGVLFLRRRDRQHGGSQEGFRTPWVWFVAPFGALASLSLMVFLSPETWVRLAVWFLVGMVIYAVFGFRNSRLHKGPLAVNKHPS